LLAGQMLLFPSEKTASLIIVGLSAEKKQQMIGFHQQHDVQN
jgi:hypothetical protein